MGISQQNDNGARKKVALHVYIRAEILTHASKKIVSYQAIAASLRVKTSTPKGLESAPCDCVLKVGAWSLCSVATAVGERLYSRNVDYCFWARIALIAAGEVMPSTQRSVPNAAVFERALPIESGHRPIPEGCYYNQTSTGRTRND